MTNEEKINEFLNKADIFYFLTADGKQPKGRPFKFHLLKNNKIYFGTGTFKNVFKQMQENPYVEILALNGDEFLRYDGEVVFEETYDMAENILASIPEMQKVYNDTTGYRLGIFHLKNGKAEICNAIGQKEVFEI